MEKIKKLSFEPAKDKRKNRWTRAATWGGHQKQNQKLTGWKKPFMSTTTYHPERSDWHDAVAPVAVGPGVPAGVLSFLQYEHLTGHVLLLIPNPAGEADKQIRKTGNLYSVLSLIVCLTRGQWLTVQSLPGWSRFSPCPSRTGYGTLQTGPSYVPGSSRIHRGISEK